MADYGIGRTGGSLRDALNAIMPMTGMGEYGAMFPPATGAPLPTQPVPLPQPRPQMPAQIPPGAFAPSSGIPPGQLQQPPGIQGPGIQGGIPPGLQAQLAGSPQISQLSGGVNVPLGPNVNAFAAGRASPNFVGGRIGPGGDYAGMLGLNRQF